ncbi:hypothetical protein [Maricaulis sp. CAU 1757]
MIITTLAAFILAQVSTDVLTENALEISGPAGSYTTYFETDGTYTTSIGISGTWEVVDGEICVVRSTGEAGCVPMREDAELGDSWDGVNAATGITVTYTIVARDAD